MAIAEVYFDEHKTYKGLCQDTSVKNWLQPFQISKTDINYICNNSDDKWAAYASLIEKDYWCVDSTGFSGIIKSKLPSGGTICN